MASSSQSYDRRAVFQVTVYTRVMYRDLAGIFMTSAVSARALTRINESCEITLTLGGSLSERGNLFVMWWISRDTHTDTSLRFNGPFFYFPPRCVCFYIYVLCDNFFFLAPRSLRASRNREFHFEQRRVYVGHVREVKIRSRARVWLIVRLE